jgi:hypothetical protein
VEVIRALGVNVIGNLDVLESRLTGPEHIDYTKIDRLPIDAAVASILGAMSTRSGGHGTKSGFLARARRKLSAR